MIGNGPFMLDERRGPTRRSSSCRNPEWDGTAYIDGDLPERRTSTRSPSA